MNAYSLYKHSIVSDLRSESRLLTKLCKRNACPALKEEQGEYRLYGEYVVLARRLQCYLSSYLPANMHSFYLDNFSELIKAFDFHMQRKNSNILIG